MADKLFVVVREDLPAGAQACQAVHAAVLFVHLHPEVEGRWWEDSKNVALLAVPDEDALRELGRACGFAGVAYAANTEPDLGDSLTSLAIAPAGKRLVRKLELLLKEPEPVVAWAVPA
jgi:hypothetical protein